MAPAAIPALNAEIGRLNGAGCPIRERLGVPAYEVGTGAPEDYAASLAADHKTWSSIIRRQEFGPSREALTVPRRPRMHSKAALSMIPKSGTRFSEEIMLHQQPRA